MELEKILELESVTTSIDNISSISQNYQTTTCKDIFEKITLWLDDCRNPYIDLEGKVPTPNQIVEWVINFEQFKQWIGKYGLPDTISFDHDLADFHDVDGEVIEYTGMTCAKWLIDYCMDNKLKLPKFFVHSANESGKKNIESILNNFNKFSEKYGR